LVTSNVALSSPTRVGYTFGGWFDNAEFNGTAVTSIPSGSIGNRDLYAKWTPTTYTITYSLEGGTVTPDNPESYTIETAAFTLNNPTRTGYTFAGWTGTNGSAPQTTVSVQGSTGNKSYTANWTIITYTVTFNANGGTATTESGTTGAGWRLASLPTPARTGYTFNGWFTEETDGTQVTTSTAFSENTTIYAQWTIATYTITYTLEGGTVTPDNPASYTIETAAFTLNNPTRTGYTFAGWTGANGSAPQTTVSVQGSTGNKSYTANWTIINYTVTFNANGGIATTESGTTGAGWRLASLPTPAREGYTFDGWFTEETDGMQVTTSTAFSENTTIYAQWTIVTYTITFNLNGGSGTAPASITSVVHGSTLSTEQKPSTTGFTRSGYVNDGEWYTATEETRSIIVSMSDSYGDGWNGAALRISVNGTNLSTNPTISSGSSSNSYSFNVNSGDVVAFYWIKGSYDSECSFTVYYSGNSSTALLQRSGSSLSSVSSGTLLGSFTVPITSNINSKFIFGDDGTEVTSNTTLYLKWIPAYTVTFNANNGTVTPSTGTTELDGTLVSLPTPARDGYTFNGWFTAATGGTAVTASTVFSANATIYAQWTLNPNTPLLPNPQIGKISVQAMGNTILLSNLPKNTKVEVYDLHGKRIYFSNSENSQILRILVQTKGMYVVKVGSQIKRVAVR
jgi:uncharacterized repeat protein (TIGR02543 family)